MNIKHLLNNVKPHAFAIATGLILVFLYFSPMFLEDKILSQNDVLQGKGGGQEIKEYREETGEEALWTNSMFSGMPAYLISLYWSGDLMKYVQDVISVGMDSSAQVIFLSFISFYILLIAFGVKPVFAFVGAVAYAFNTFSIISIEAGHIWKVRAMAYMPLVLAGIHLMFSSRKKLLAFALTAMAVALELRANHLQITYYLLIFLVGYGIFQITETVKSGEWKDFGKNVALLLFAAFLGLGANAGRIWTTLEYSKYSTRGPSELTVASDKSPESGLDRDYVFNWSYGIVESFTLIIPNFSGGPSQMPLDEKSNLGEALRGAGASRAQVANQLQYVPTYWGKQPSVAGPTYIGAVLFFLVILGWFYLPVRLRNTLLIISGFSLLLAWGKNLEWFNYFMYDYFPGYNKFRSVSMAMTILLLAVPLMAVLGLDRFIKSEDQKKKKKLLYAAAIAAGVLLLIWIVSFTFSFRGPVDERLGGAPDWYLRALREDRQSLLQKDIFRSLLFIAFTAAILYFRESGRIKNIVAFILIALAVTADFYLVDKRYLNDSNFVRPRNTQFLTESPADERIKNSADGHYRVLNLVNPFNEAKTSYQHSSLGGYHGAKIKRYQQLIEYCLSSDIQTAISRLQDGSRNFSDLTRINMLNARFLKFGEEAQNVLVNPSAYGNAWLVDQLKVVNSANEEIQATCDLSSKTTAVINSAKFEIPQQNFNPNGEISLVEYAPNELEYAVDAKGQAFAVFSEIYYPEGWQAFIDDQPAKIYQVNYVLRGLEIPQGLHTIKFKFSPESYETGNMIMLIFSGLILVIFGVSIVREIRK